MYLSAQIPRSGLLTLQGLEPKGSLGAISSSATSTIADTIQRIEGYYPGTLAYKNNNPGNLIYVGQTGAVKGEGGFAKFPTYEAGRAALENQIGIYANRGLTIDSMMAIYAPKGHGSNDPEAYANSIASTLGVSPSTPLSSLGIGPSDSSIDASASDASTGGASFEWLTNLLGSEPDPSGSMEFSSPEMLLGLGLAAAALVLLFNSRS